MKRIAAILLSAFIMCSNTMSAFAAPLDTFSISSVDVEETMQEVDDTDVSDEVVESNAGESEELSESQEDEEQNLNDNSADVEESNENSEENSSDVNDSNENPTDKENTTEEGITGETSEENTEESTTFEEEAEDLSVSENEFSLEIFSDDTTTTGSQIDVSGTYTYYFKPKTPISIGDLNFNFNKDSSGTTSNRNTSTEKYRLLFFVPIEAYRDNGDSDGDVRGMWEEFYQNDMYNSDLLLNSPYVDLIFLDTGRSEKTEIAKIHKAAKTFAMSGVDKSIWCYDEGETDADNAIWQAYKAYSELCPGMVTASQWIKYSDAEPSPCGGYFLINEKNEIVMYGWDDISMMYPVDYIRLNAIKKAVAPTNIEVTNMQGEVTFSWVMADENNTGVAYRVDSDGTVDSSGSHYDFSYDGKKITYVVKTGAAGDEDNYICRYQFAELDKYYVESEKSKTVSNEGMECPRDPELIKDAKLVQVENKTESEISDTEGIEISQGETAGIKVKLEKYSGEYEEVQASQDFDWYITDSEGEIIESDEPIKYWVDDLLDMTHIYVKGISLTGENTYYLNCDYYYQDKSYYEDISVPIKVVQAQAGDSFISRDSEEPSDIYDSIDELRTVIHDNLADGVEEFKIAVKAELWDEWNISVTTLDLPQPFWDEEPWTEGIGIYVGGMIWSPWDDMFCDKVDYKGDMYYVYEYVVEYDKEYGGFYAPFEWQEEQIDNLVNKPTGALYPYKNADEYTKVKAVYDYVRKNIRYIGTTDGLYHSLYGALKTKKATCEGYSELTSRLLWALDVKNCCMTDNFAIGAVIGVASVHAYNIVEVEGQTYFLDTSSSSGIFLKGKETIGDRDFQERCLWYGQKYVDKLSNADYKYVPKYVALYKVTDGLEEEIGSYKSFAEAKTAIEEDISNSSDEGEAVSENSYAIKLRGDVTLADNSLDDSDTDLTVYLNGYTMTVDSNVSSRVPIHGGTDRTGTIKVIDGHNFTIIPKESDSEVELSNVVFDSEDDSEVIIGSTEHSGTVELINVGNSKMDKMTVNGNVKISGTMNIKDLTIAKGKMEAGALNVTESLTAFPGTQLFLNKVGTINNITVEEGDYFEIGLLRSDDNTQNGQLKFTGKLINNTGTDYAFRINKYNCAGENVESDEFVSGEIVATITAAKDNFAEKQILLSGNKLKIERDGNNLLAAVETVKVSYFDTESGYGEEKVYSSLKKAIADMGEVAGKKNGTYKFDFIENAMLSGDVNLPNYVKKAVFTADTDTIVDFKGYKIKTSADIGLEGQIIFTEDTIQAATLKVDDGNRTLKNVNVKTLDMSESSVADLSIDVFKATASVKVGKNDILRVNKASGIKDVELKPYAALIVNDFEQSSSGKTYLWTDSQVVVNKSATICNPIMNSENAVGTGTVNIYKTENAKINLLGKLTRNAQKSTLAIGSITNAEALEAGTVLDMGLQDYTKATPLFDTKISKLDLSVVEAINATENCEYDAIYQIGNTVYVGKNVIYVGGNGANNNPIEEKGFAKWSDAINYLNTYAHANSSFEIHVMESVDINEKLTMPKKAGYVWLYSGEKLGDGTAESEGEVTLTYLNDITLVGNTRIENLNLQGQKYDSKLKENVAYASVLKLSGKNLEMVNVEADLASVAGSSKSTWTLEDSVIDVEKTVSSLGNLNMTDSEVNAAKAVSGIANLDMTDSVLKADNVTVAKVTTMDGATIDCITKMTLNDVVSNSEKNVLAYGGNTSKNMLTIKGNVYVANKDEAEDELEDVQKNVTLVSCNGEQQESVSIRQNAITLKVKSLEAEQNNGECGYKNASALCSAVKAGTSWFVVGSKWNNDGTRASVEHTAYKDGKNIASGSGGTLGNVVLYSSKSGTGNTYVVEGGYKSLQEALTDIDKLAVSSNYYKLVLEDVTKDVVTPSKKGLTFPSKTKGILITADEELEEPNIYFKGNLALKSDTALEEINLVPTSKAGITLGKYTLTLTGCKWNAGNGTNVISQIGGAKGVSKLVLEDTALEVAGNVNNVGTIVFAGEAKPSLKATGTISIGDVELEKDGYLTGLAAVTRKKDSKTKETSVTKIDSKITITGEVSGKTGSENLYLDLQEKVGKEVVILDLSTENNAEMQGMLNSGIKMAKANLVTYSKIRALQKDGNEDNNLIKSGGYLMYYPDEHGAEVSFAGAEGNVTVNCFSLGDAVTEINNYKTKRAYTISLTEENEEISGVNQEGTAFVPQKFAMPKSNVISSLILESAENTPIKLGYMNGIAFTSDTTLKDIDFVQMVKVKSSYVPVDDASAKGDYPGIVTVSTGGYTLDVEGAISFNTPITLDGKNKGTLNLDGDETINTWTNGYSTECEEYTRDLNALKNDPMNKNENEKVSIIHGSITGFKEVNMNNCDMLLKEYKTSAKSYKPSNNKVTNLNLNYATIVVLGYNTKNSFKITNYTENNGGCSVYGSGK